MSDLEDRAIAEKVRLAVRALNDALAVAAAAGIHTHVAFAGLADTATHAAEILTVELTKIL